MTTANRAVHRGPANAPGSPRGARLLASVVGVVLLGTAPWAASAEGSATSATTTTGDALARSTTLRVGTYNIQAGRSLADFEAGITALKERVDVAGLQEIASRERRDSLDEDSTWGVFRPTHLGQVPIIWNRSKLAFVNAHESLLAGSRWIEGQRGGRELKNPTYAAVVRLQDRATGHRVEVVNVHLLSASTRGGVARPEAPLRHEYYVDQVKALQQLVADDAALGNDVFVTGDFNIGYVIDERMHRRRHPYRRLSAIGMHSVWQGRSLSARGTHENTHCPPRYSTCGAYLDQVWAHERPVKARVAVGVVHSDHFPAVATYDLQG